MTNDKYVNNQIIKIQADIKNNNLGQAAMVYEDIINHIKNTHYSKKKKDHKVYYLPAKFSTISEQVRNQVN